MSSWVKTLVVLALVVPMTAYVAGSLVSSRSYDPSDRTPVIIQDVSTPEPRTERRDRRRPGGADMSEKSERSGGQVATTPTPAPTPAPTRSPTGRGNGQQSPSGTVDDDDATVVTPQPTPVDDDDDDEDDGPEGDDDDDEADDGDD